MHNAKIAILDIETAPTMAYVWRRWKENIRLDQVVREGYVLCAVAKFLDERSARSLALPECATWGVDKEDDREVVEFCWRVLDEADVVIAHFAKGFDIPVLNARFISLGLPPPSPYKIIDTKEVAKKKFRFPYNSLDGIGEYLGEGRKMDTDFKLWVRCLNGEMAAWKYMVKYCVRDVLLLERVYKRLVPWIDNHPNVALWGKLDKECCPKCGSGKIQWRGVHRTLTREYRRFQCQSCGGWGRVTKTTMDDEKKPFVVTHAVVS